jgi:undecaprenyl diphosphate synthase
LVGKGPKAAVGDDQRVQQELQRSGEIPRHVAVIMDGNGRWAKQRGMPRIAGHTEGVESVRDVVEACGQLGVEFLTLYAFSTENWKRPQEEVSLLMRLLLKALRDEADRLHQNNVRLNAIGQLTALPQEIQSELLDGIQKTKNNTGLNLTLALSYSGRWEITEAVKRIARDVAARRVEVADITERLLTAYLATEGIPDPDLLVRTSGELRISNFLLWQLAYTEIYITPKYWPAFRRDELYAAIRDYQRRERRFGMVSEQVSPAKPADQPPSKKVIKSVTGS